MTEELHTFVFGETKIWIEYHSTEIIRGWSYRVGGNDNIHSARQQYGYGSIELAKEAAIEFIQNQISFIRRKCEDHLARTGLVEAAIVEHLKEGDR